LQAEDGIRDFHVTGVQTCALPIFATNLVTLGVLAWLARPLVGRFVQPLDGRMIRLMLGESWPLMLNHLLATVFFKIDVVLMEAKIGRASWSGKVELTGSSVLVEEK